MRVIVQRSKKSEVLVDNKIVGKIDSGLVLLVGFTHTDTLEDILYMVKKIVNLRIFDDVNHVMNKSILDINGSILSISQFTLYGDTKKGNRPSYINAMKSEDAKKMYDEFNRLLSEHVNVSTGIFQADMDLRISNDGPVTIILESGDKVVKER